jgi:hypothetical protein
VLLLLLALREKMENQVYVAWSAETAQWYNTRLIIQRSIGVPLPLLPLEVKMVNQVYVAWSAETAQW